MITGVEGDKSQEWNASSPFSCCIILKTQTMQKISPHKSNNVQTSFEIGFLFYQAGANEFRKPCSISAPPIVKHSNTQRLQIN